MILKLDHFSCCVLIIQILRAVTLLFNRHKLLHAEENTTQMFGHQSPSDYKSRGY